MSSHSTTWSLEGRTALVTGAGSGIGREIAIEFAAEGCTVLALDWSSDAATATADAITGDGGTATPLVADVSKADEVERAVSTALAESDVAILVNCAAIEGEKSETALCSEANWDAVLDVNLKGVWLLCKSLLPHFQKRNGGCIINVASIAGAVAWPGYPAYCAAKAGIVGLTRNMAVEYAPWNIRANCIAPGSIATPMADRIIAIEDASRDEIEQAEVLGRFGRPEEIAAAAVFLASDRASFVVGETFVVDGAASVI